MRAPLEPTLSLALRTATGPAHERLEAALGLLSPPLSQARFRRALEGFYGFHVAWEPAVATHEGLAPLAEGRGRITALRHDLRRLGLAEAEIDALPICEEAARLVAEPLAAIGSLYVMEGSTLGGQVIARDLRLASWAPEGGLTYFNPYGPETGSSWRTFKTKLDGAVEPADWPIVIKGAVHTFDVLREWLGARIGAA